MELINKLFAFSYNEISSNMTILTTKITTIIAIIIASRVIKKLIIKSMSNICKTRNIDKHTCIILKKIAAYTISTMTAVLILQNIGIEVSPLITALGVSGVALSFGMKDTISNVIAGILIMAYQQFKVDDYIKIKDWQGKVIDINVRYTTLETDDMTIYIPNSVLYTSTVAIIHSK